MLCHLMWRTAANTCSLTFRMQASEFRLAAMSELLVQDARPAGQFAKIVRHVWRRVFDLVGPARILDPTSMGDCTVIARS